MISLNSINDFNNFIKDSFYWVNQGFTVLNNEPVCVLNFNMCITMRKINILTDQDLIINTMQLEKKRKYDLNLLQLFKQHNLKYDIFTGTIYQNAKSDLNRVLLYFT